MRAPEAGGEGGGILRGGILNVDPTKSLPLLSVLYNLVVEPVLDQPSEIVGAVGGFENGELVEVGEDGVEEVEREGGERVGGEGEGHRSLHCLPRSMTREKGEVKKVKVVAACRLLLRRDGEGETEAGCERTEAR